MPGSPPLDTHPPERTEGSILPLQALTEGFQVLLTNLRILGVIGRVGQGYEEQPALEEPEGSAVDGGELPK